MHRSEAIRVQVKRIIQGIGWTRVAEEIERLAREGDPERFGFILSGLAAFESHKDVVVLLDRLVDILKGDLRTDLWPQLFSDVNCIALWISSEKILTRLYSVLHWFHKRLEVHVKNPRENRCFQIIIVCSFV